MQYGWLTLLLWSYLSSSFVSNHSTFTRMSRRGKKRRRKFLSNSRTLTTLSEGELWSCQIIQLTGRRRQACFSYLPFSSLYDVLIIKSLLSPCEFQRHIAQVIRQRERERDSSNWKKNIDCMFNFQRQSLIIVCDLTSISNSHLN